MPAKIVSCETAEHYTWGGPGSQDCDGWHLVDTPDLSILEEKMPPGTSETRHFHHHARQFFFVLEGKLTLEIEHSVFQLRVGKGIEVSPGQQHQAMNLATVHARFLVTSQPPSHGDKFPA